MLRLFIHIYCIPFFMVIALVIYKNYASIRIHTPYQLVILALLISITIGIHGISHLGLEKYMIFILFALSYIMSSNYFL